MNRLDESCGDALGEARPVLINRRPPYDFGGRSAKFNGLWLLCNRCAQDVAAVGADVSLLDKVARRIVGYLLDQYTRDLSGSDE